MFNFEELLTQLPELPTFSGRWVPVYIEPMMASGEKLTAVIAAVGNDGSSLVRPAIRKEKALAMYGAKGEDFYSIIETLAASFQYHLQTQQSFDSWMVPFNGVTLGEVREAVSKDIVGILRQAVAMTASLSVPEFDEVPDNTPTEKNDAWPAQVREEVLKVHPSLEEYFRGEFHTSKYSKACKLFFLSPNIAVNTGKLIPGPSVSHHFELNKSKILDLLTVKENEGAIAPRHNHELIVRCPSKDDTTYSKRTMDSLEGYINALIDAGDKHEIRVTTTVTPKDAAKRLCEIEFK